MTIINAYSVVLCPDSLWDRRLGEIMRVHLGGPIAMSALSLPIRQLYTFSRCAQAQLRISKRTSGAISSQGFPPRTGQAKKADWLAFRRRSTLQTRGPPDGYAQFTEAGRSCWIVVGSVHSATN